MRIARATLTAFRLPLRTPLVTARGRSSAREGVLVALETAAGCVGHGEAMPLPGFGLETPERARDAIAAAARACVGRDFADLDAALDRMALHTARARSARAALDVALHDLAAQERGVPLAVLLCEGAAAEPRARVAVGALLAGEAPARAADEARSAVAQGFLTLKLKLGAADLARDAERAAAVRQAAGDGVALRLDANGAWDEATARRALARLAPLTVEFVEQPVLAADVAALARVRATSPIPIAADEAVGSVRGADALLARGAADLLIVKPAAVGGLRAARSIAALARSAGADVVVTGFLDSALGTAAALHLAAALPGPARAAGLGTGSWLAGDLAPPAEVRGGALRVPRTPGLGVAPDPEALRAFATGPGLEIAA